MSRPVPTGGRQGGGRQLAFDLGERAALGRDDFLVAPANAAAVAWIDLWPQWAAPTLAVFGPPGCGKTHLSAVFRSRSGAKLLTPAELSAMSIGELTAAADAVVVDLGHQSALADGAQEQALFHLMNLVGERRGSLLLVAREAPARWPVALADLKSRLGAAPAVGIAPPDDALIAALLIKLFADRQLRVGEDVVRYLAERIERSFEATRSIVARLDAAALSGQRNITVPFARSVLEQGA